MENLINIKEAARLLGVSLYTLRNYVAWRRIPYIKIGRRVLFDVSDLAAYIASRKVAPRREVA